MTSFINWFVPTAIGVQFILLGSLKLYGLGMGIVGGADKPFVIFMPNACLSFSHILRVEP
jgi:hypothetical protein